MTVDEILATGEYVDRQGRGWRYCNELMECWWAYGLDGGFDHREMSTMLSWIARDMHRDECAGLRRCYNHPAPSILALQDDMGGPEWGHGFGVYRPGAGDEREEWVDTLPAALDAARALAVGE